MTGSDHAQLPGLPYHISRYKIVGTTVLTTGNDKVCKTRTR